MKYRLWCKELGDTDDSAWYEDYDRRCADAEADARALVDSFNATLHASERAREFLRVEVGAGGAVLAHAWGKTNLVTVRKPGGRMHDAYRCADCGATGKRYELEGGVVLDYRYRGRRACPGGGAAR